MSDDQGPPLHAIRPTHRETPRLRLAIVASGLLHAALFAAMAGLARSPPPETTPPVVAVQLLPPEPQAEAEAEAEPVTDSAPATPQPAQAEPQQPPPPATLATVPQPVPAPSPTAHRAAAVAPLKPRQITHRRPVSPPSKTTVAIPEATESGSAPMPPQAAAPAPPPATSTANAAADGMQAYLSDIQRLVERHMVYPQIALRRGEQGMVPVRAVVARDGALLEAAAETTDTPLSLRDAAVQAVRKAAPFPSLPLTVAAAQATLVIPVEFVIR
jgi:protein TonB